MGNTQNKKQTQSLQQINYKQTIKEGIQIIKEWINKQQNNESLEENKEVLRVIKEIEEDNDYSKDGYEDIRFILKPFEEILPLQIKRIFNLSRMDQYTMFITTRWFETIEDHINLIMTTRRFKNNMTKYHYNPISLTQTTRDFFPNLQTLYIYSMNEEIFEGDSRIIFRKEIKDEKYGLYLNEKKIIEEWSENRFGEILFDSDNDKWNESTNIISTIVGKKQLLFLIETEDKEKFGYYYDTVIHEKPEFKQGCVVQRFEDVVYNIELINKIPPTNKKTFLFNIESNGRLSKPMKFEIKDITKGRFHHPDDENNYLLRSLIDLGDIHLMCKDDKEKSFCFQNEDVFVYHGIEKALCGKVNKSNFLILFLIQKEVVSLLNEY